MGAIAINGLWETCKLQHCGILVIVDINICQVEFRQGGLGRGPWTIEVSVQDELLIKIQYASDVLVLWWYFWHACLSVSLEENVVAAAVGIINAILELGEELVGFLLLCKPLKQ